MKIALAGIIEKSGVRFGTSGARGLADAITDEVAYAYTRAFLEHVARTGQSGAGPEVAIAGDLRPSTARIMAAVARAVRDAGRVPLNCGTVPTPAVAVLGLLRRIPAVMVTGSHIPDDRNGIKYYVPSGEIMKDDEAGILASTVALDAAFDARGMLAPAVAVEALGEVRPDAADAYVARWTHAFPADWLGGLRVGLYEHSGVGRDLLGTIYARLGATVLPFGRSARFVPVDTEAIRPEDALAAAQFAAEERVDAIVSTDGDADRPLLADERGRFLRGDVTGILVARFLGADAVVTPVSSNTALEKCGAFPRVVRTRIGSPFVIEAMQDAARAGAQTVVGYEANGGFLTATEIAGPAGPLPALPTRDPVIVHLAVLGAARRAGLTVAELADELPRRAVFSERLKEFPIPVAAARLAALRDGGAAAFAADFPDLARPVALDETDGLRFTLESGDVVHLRPSGNAPELRCYVESDDAVQAERIARGVLARLEGWRP